MKKSIISVAVLLFSCLAYSQVGINNQSPKATLDITAKTTDGSKAEGVIAPRLTGDQLKAGDAVYTSAQTGAIVYVTAAVTTASAKTVNITSPGYYYFDGTLWSKLGGIVSDAVPPEIVSVTGNYTVKSNDFFLKMNPTSGMININLPTTGIPVGKVIYLSNKGTEQVNFTWDGVAPQGSLFYNDQTPSYIPPGYSGVLYYLGGTGQGAWAFTLLLI